MGPSAPNGTRPGRPLAWAIFCAAGSLAACDRAPAGTGGRGAEETPTSTPAGQAAEGCTGIAAPDAPRVLVHRPLHATLPPAARNPDAAVDGDARSADDPQGDATEVGPGEPDGASGDGAPPAAEGAEVGAADSAAPPDGERAAAPSKAAAPFACLGEPPSDPAPWVIGYYVPRRRSRYPPEKVQWRALTHLAVGSVAPRADGPLDTTFGMDGMSGTERVDDLIARAHAAGVKALLFVGGGATHDDFAAAASGEVRASFVAELVRWARDEHDLDGIDLDWEPMRQADHRDFRALAEALRAAWPEALLTVPVVHHNVNLAGVDPFWAKVAPLFDRINIMSYGMAGEYPGWRSWHASALHGAAHESPTTIADSVEAYLAVGVPAEKLGIGIGFYGVCYTPPVAGPRGCAADGSAADADRLPQHHDALERTRALGRARLTT